MGPKDAQARGQRGDETVASPLEVTSLFSAYYSDAARFPASSLEFDCALLMRDVPHQWRALPSMYTGGAPGYSRCCSGGACSQCAWCARAGVFAATHIASGLLDRKGYDDGTGG